MIDHKNQPDAFSELRFDWLSRYAKERAEEFPEISRVILYRYSTVNPVAFRNIPTKFVVVFEVIGKNSAEVYGDLVKATEYYHTVKDEHCFGAFIKDASFPSTVYYQQPPANDFRKEWMFFVRLPDSRLPLGVSEDRPSWILFDLHKTGTQHQPAPNRQSGVLWRGDMETYPEFFKKLKIDTLKSYAKDWISDYPALMEIHLYRGNHAHYRRNTYVLVAVYNEQSEPDRMEFLRWAGDGNWHLQEILPNFYKTTERTEIALVYEWAWYPIPSTQGSFDIENHPLSDFVVKKDHIVLFPEKLPATPQNQETLPASDEEKAKMTEGFLHSEDFRSVTKNGVPYSLTAYQATVIKLLYEAYQRGTPELGQAYILETIGSGGQRLRDLFKSNMDAWLGLVKHGKRRGLFQLNI